MTAYENALQARIMTIYENAVQAMNEVHTLKEVEQAYRTYNRMVGCEYAQDLLNKYNARINLLKVYGSKMEEKMLDRKVLKRFGGHDVKWGSKDVLIVGCTSVTREELLDLLYTMDHGRKNIEGGDYVRVKGGGRTGERGKVVLLKGSSILVEFMNCREGAKIGGNYHVWGENSDSKKLVSVIKAGHWDWCGVGELEVVE